MKSGFFAPAALLGALLFSTTAQAQYVWIDQNNRKQYSDMPPPPSVPANRILKQPGSVPAPSVDAPAAADGAAQKAKAVAPPAAPTLAERDADFRKRRAEQKEKEKVAAEAARIAAENRKRCERLEGYRRSLESGALIARSNKKGEPEALSSVERERELADTKRSLAECQK